MSDEMLKLENQLCFPLYAASRRVIRLYRPVLDELGLTYTQYITLLALWEHDEISVKTLGERLYLDSGTLTPLLKKLQAQGLIERERDEADERALVVRLTAEGRALKKRARDVPRRVASCVRLQPEDAQELHRLLHVLLSEDVLLDCESK